jgi:hypothetical protein
MTKYLVAIIEKGSFVEPKIIEGNSSKDVISKYNKDSDNIASGQVVAKLTHKCQYSYWCSIVGLPEYRIKELVEHCI